MSLFAAHLELVNPGLHIEADGGHRREGLTKT